MIKRIETEDGERWAIVLHDSDTLEDVKNYANGLLETLITATGSDAWDGTNDSTYWVLNLLRHFTPSDDDIIAYNHKQKAYDFIVENGDAKKFEKYRVDKIMNS